MAGMLSLCATPIGNLEDMTDRVKRTLQEADLIAAEDTRDSLRLLHHFGIKTPMTSYHEHNKVEKGEYLLGRMQAGEKIALITDAGTPAISDPGEELVIKCREAGIEVTSLPGPCALVTAVSLSGLSARRFCFEGFLPADKKERKSVLSELTEESRTMVLYEGPHRLRKTLAELLEALGNRRISLCRELTKKFESVMEMTLEEAIDFYGEKEPRGEYVLVIEGKSTQVRRKEEQEAWQEKTLCEHMAYYEEQGIMGKEAMKLVAKDRGIGKREVYQALCRKIERT